MEWEDVKVLAALIGIVYFIVFIDKRRGKKAAELNGLGLCAKCKKPLGPVSDSILVSGGGRGGGMSAYVCHNCAKRNRLVVFSVMTFIFFVIILLGFNLFFLK